jgi:hypothetical protein
MSDIPRELNWVKERFECSIAIVFQQLKLAIEEDCRTYNVLNQLPPAISYRTVVNPEGNVLMVCHSMDTRRVIKVSVGNSSIQIDNEVTHEKFTVTLTLNDEGRCKCKIGTEELEQWQVRRRILEGLFWGPL